ncbi:TauD/TfdA dioxygenase family protein [Acinetobacter terrestris]|jgi:taurine dioxygenase|uniref:TauD/TfdA family dioxygenase n=1 Tax=Acinetobacter terrestris TaxID=2529843 RepID=A0AAW6UVW4_9GAMM|nr:TauD/TfdA family dioxygenase [Acinetobacter terrestris]MDK1685050.1 TauD/TfdA family dioxygenase [Acinetobacter terrestris]
MKTFTERKQLKLVPIAERYKYIQPKPQLPNFAAIIEGVDLTQPLTEEVKQELRQALLDFEVIFFPPVEISNEQHVELARVFGPISLGAFHQRSGDNPEIEVIENDASRPPEIDHWHTDISWVENPPRGTVIQIREVPPYGGNTVWSSMSKAYEGLSTGFKTYLQDLNATHTWEVSKWREYLEILGDEALVKGVTKFKPVHHKIAKYIPEVDKTVLYVNETFTKRIDDVPENESKYILRFLAEWIKSPEYTYSHRWEKNGIAIWDNRLTQHFAIADFWPNRRQNYRVTFNEPDQVEQLQGKKLTEQLIATL